MGLNIPPPDLRTAEGEAVPLDEMAARVLITLTIMERKGDANAIRDMAEKFAGFLPYAVLDRRLSLSKHGDRITPQVRILCGLLSRSPGDAVMWAWTLHNMAAALEKSEQEDPLNLPRGVLNIQQWVDAFPMGTPSDEDRGLIWDRQKCMPMVEHRMAPDNLLDYPELWEGQFDALRTKVQEHPTYGSR